MTQYCSRTRHPTIAERLYKVSIWRESSRPSLVVKGLNGMGPRLWYLMDYGASRSPCSTGNHPRKPTASAWTPKASQLVRRLRHLRGPSMKMHVLLMQRSLSGNIRLRLQVQQLQPLIPTAGMQMAWREYAGYLFAQETSPIASTNFDCAPNVEMYLKRVPQSSSTSMQPDRSSILLDTACCLLDHM